MFGSLEWDSRNLAASGLYQFKFQLSIYYGEQTAGPFNSVIVFQRLESASSQEEPKAARQSFLALHSWAAKIAGLVRHFEIGVECAFEF